MKFQAKGTYIAFDDRNNCIGAFDTLAKAKRACANESHFPMGSWKTEQSRWDTSNPAWFVSYYSDRSGCAIHVGYDHPLVKVTQEEIEAATRRTQFRETLR